MLSYTSASRLPSPKLALKLAHGERDSINDQQYKGQRAVSSRMWTAVYHIINMQYICACVLPITGSWGTQGLAPSAEWKGRGKIGLYV